MQCAREQAKIETEKYKRENEEKTILIPFHSDRQLDYNKHLIFTHILDPNSKRSSFKSAQTFLEAPSYELHDIYRALNILADECDFIH